MRNLLSLLLILSLSLAGCGGSGSAAGPASTQLKLTGANAPAAAARSYEAARGSGELGEVGGAVGFGSTKPGSAGKPAFSASGGLLVSSLQKIPFGPDLFPCQVAGSLTLSGDVADPFSLTPGDFIVIAADNCDDGLGEVIDGDLRLDITSFAGDLGGGVYELGADVTIDSLTLTTAEDVITQDGDVSIVLDTLQAPLLASSTSGASLSVSTNSLSETLSNFDATSTLDAGLDPAPYTLSASGTLDSSALDGTISYSTPVRFEGFDNDYPGSDELLVQGDASTLRLIALDAVNVRIEVDEDGDGSVDQVIDMTWSTLLES